MCLGACERTEEPRDSVCAFARRRCGRRRCGRRWCSRPRSARRVIVGHGSLPRVEYRRWKSSRSIRWTGRRHPTRPLFAAMAQPVGHETCVDMASALAGRAVARGHHGVFGAFPKDPTAVQLDVMLAFGRAERFGPVRRTRPRAHRAAQRTCAGIGALLRPGPLLRGSTARCPRHGSAPAVCSPAETFAADCVVYNRVSFGLHCNQRGSGHVTTRTEVL